MFRWLINMMITSMIFFPEKAFYETPEQYGLNWEDVFIQTEDQVKIHGWYLDAPLEKGVILFFHGNAGNISGRLFKAKGWIDRGYSVLLIDYRGYGKSEKKIEHGKDILVDAQAAFRWLTEVRKISPEKLVLYGESIGTYPALQLATANRVGGVVLEAPFTSFYELAHTHYPFVPKVFLKDFEFSNIDIISQINSPLFILHGDRDEICPYRMSEELFKIAPEPKELFTIPQGGHNDLPNIAGSDFWEKPYRFIATRQTS
ncbi:MAG TPA: alpha/beta hydrolase [bacterium]|nr:alpha/beta hydrolase [bacterium]